jgi:hypothetical protein
MSSAKSSIWQLKYAIQSWIRDIHVMSSHRHALQHFWVATLVTTTDPNLNPDATKISNQNRWLVVAITPVLCPTFFVVLWQQNMINYTTSSDEESCTLKWNLASKIEIWNQFIIKCDVNSPQIRLTNFIYEPNTLPGVCYISQCYYYPHYFQKQHCHYLLLAKAVLDTFEYLLHSLYNMMPHQNGNLVNRFHHHSQLMSVQNTSILLCVAKFIKHLQYLHVYIKHMHEKCLQKTLAVGLSKISFCRDETIQMVKFTLYKRF